MKKLKDLKLGTLRRSEDLELDVVTLEREDGAAEGEPAPKLFTVSMSSERAVQRWFGRETLLHSNAAIDASYLNRGMAVLVRHQGEPVGVVREWSLDEKSKKIRGKVQFSRSIRGREVQQDVEDGVLHFTSMGYDPLKAKVTKDSAEPMEREILITRWLPKELTLAAIPEDPTVGVGRESGGEERPVEIEGESGGETQPAEVRSMCDKCKQAPCACQNAGGGTATITVGDSNTQREAAVKEARENTSAIYALVASNGLPAKRAEEFVGKGMTRDQAAWEILNERTTRGDGTPASELLDNVPRKDLARYNMARAIDMACLVREGKGKYDGVEGEIHTELHKKLPVTAQYHGGVLVPHRTREASGGTQLGQIMAQLNREQQVALTRALSSIGASAGAETVFDQPGDLIELLRNRSVLGSMGARILSGLNAPVPFPKHTGTAVPRWIGENPAAAAAASQLSTGIVTLSPKTLIGTTSYSRQLLMLASVDTDAMVRDDLAAAHGLAVDLAGIHGIGAAGEPLGLYSSPDVQVTSSFGAPTFVKIIALITKVAKQNALRNALGWVTTPEMAGVLATTPKHATAAAGFVWDGTVLDGVMGGYRAMSSNQISATMNVNAPTGGSEHGLIFGNWADMLVGLWGGLEILPDPLTLADSGLVKITSFQMADVLLRHGQSFAKATGATLA